MTTVLRPAFAGSFFRRWWRISLGSLRLTAYLAVVFAALAAVCARRAWGAFGEASLATGRQLAGLADVLGTTKSLAFNGQTVHVATAVVEMPVGAVLDRFDAACASAPSGFVRLLAELPSAEAQALRGEVAAHRLRFGTLRKDDAGDGIVACLLDARHGTGLGVDALQSFVTSGDLSVLGDMVLVYAKAVDGGKTHVVTTWSEGRFPILELFPARGDAPGSDSALGARPEGRRLLSVTAVDAPYAVRVYEAAAPAPEVLAGLTAALKDRGWQAQDDVEDGSPSRVFLHESGVLQHVVAREHDGMTVVSVAEMGGAAERSADRAEQPTKREGERR